MKNNGNEKNIHNLSVGQLINISYKNDEPDSCGIVFAFTDDVVVLDAVNKDGKSAENKLPGTGVRLVNADIIKAVEVVEQMVPNFDHKLPEISKELVQEREKHGIRQAQAMMHRKGKGVTSYAQSLFDELSKTYTLAWSGKNIEFSELDIVIKPPYEPENCFGEDSLALERIKKIVNLISQGIGK